MDPGYNDRIIFHLNIQEESLFQVPHGFSEIDNWCSFSWKNITHPTMLGNFVYLTDTLGLSPDC